MRRKVCGKLYGGMGSLLAIVPMLTVCPKTITGTRMACWDSALAILPIGIVIILLGMAAMKCRSTKMCVVVHIGAAVTAYLGALIPLRLIGGCHVAGMICTVVAFPMIYIMTGITVIAALIFLCVELVELCQQKASEMECLCLSVKNDPKQ